METYGNLGFALDVLKLLIYFVWQFLIVVFLHSSELSAEDDPKSVSKDYVHSFLWSVFPSLPW